MEETKNKTTHGGRRAGAGRPKKDIGKYFGFNATVAVTAILESLEGSKSEFINEAVAELAKRRGLM